MKVEQEIIFWVLSTVAQTYGAVLAVIGAFIIHRLTNLKHVKDANKQVSNISNIQKKFFVFLSFHILIISLAIILMRFPVFLGNHLNIFFIALVISVFCSILATINLCLESIEAEWKELRIAVWDTIKMLWGK